MRESIQIIKTKIISILKRHGVSKAAIFGSLARGEEGENSDIDILIELKGEKSLLDLIGLKIELEEVLGKKVDLVEYSTIHPFLKDRILKEQMPIL